MHSLIFTAILTDIIFMIHDVQYIKSYLFFKYVEITCGNILNYWINIWNYMLYLIISNYLRKHRIYKVLLLTSYLARLLLANLDGIKMQ